MNKRQPGKLKEELRTLELNGKNQQSRMGLCSGGTTMCVWGEEVRCTPTALHIFSMKGRPN